MVEPSDNELIRSVQEGNIGAYEVIVRRYQAKLLSYVYHFVRNNEDAQDIVLEALFNLYRTIDRVDTGKKFSSYVFSIAKNAALSFLRKKKLEVALNEGELVAEDGSLYDELFAQEDQKRIRHAMKKLNRRYKTVIQLYYFRDLSYEEIAKKLKLPIGTVRTHLLRGKKELRNLLTYEKG